MSVIKEAVNAMKEVLLLTGKVEQTGNMLSQISTELRQHDRRLVRLETIIEINQAKNRPKKLN